MKRTALKNIDAFKIMDENTGESFYGCSQDWFGTEWQRMAGCGPSVVSNMMIYRNNIDQGGNNKVNRKTSCLSLMEEVWKFVTPTPRGIPSTDLLCEFVGRYAASMNRHVACAHCEVPQDPSLRPPVPEVASYLEKALASDIPVAFLNLCSGDEENLDEWHWVTVVSLEQAASGGHALLKILDRGFISAVDLDLWLKTTKNGGGFVYFEIL
ncbi:MAG: hypothetical protein LBR87_09370 [Synergistaceae bacterium]|jgi:hypothetical protein|nr:hypothetical protein [Synergistaceae bacterium]